MSVRTALRYCTPNWNFTTESEFFLAVVGQAIKPALPHVLAFFLSFIDIEPHAEILGHEPELVALSRKILERLGYQIVTKNNGIDALKEFRKKPNHFDVVVTDMTMPKMTGERLAQELISIRPDIPIILCTGFSEQINEQKAKAIGIKAFLMKPLTVNQLAKTVRAVLEKKPTEK